MAKRRKRYNHKFFIQDSDDSTAEWGKADHHYTVDGTLVIDNTSYELFGDILLSKLSPKSSAFSRKIASDRQTKIYKYSGHGLNQSDRRIDNTCYYDFDNNLGLEKKFW
jgi:hypothetical protein